MAAHGSTEIAGQFCFARVRQAACGDGWGQIGNVRVKIDRLRQTKACGHLDMVALCLLARQARRDYPPVELSPRNGDVDMVAATVSMARRNPWRPFGSDAHQVELKCSDAFPLPPAGVVPAGQGQGGVQKTCIPCHPF